MIAIAQGVRLWKAEDTRAHTETITVQNASDWFMPRNSITRPRLFTHVMLATPILSPALVNGPDQRRFPEFWAHFPTKANTIRRRWSHDVVIWAPSGSPWTSPGKLHLRWAVASTRSTYSKAEVW